MDVLPRTINSPSQSANAFSSSSSSSSSRSGAYKFRMMLRRMFKFSQMDFEVAAWNITYLLIAPRRVYRNVYYHKQTKNTWSRDDPAMLLLVSGGLALSGFLWSVLYAGYSFSGVLSTMVRMVLVDFVLVGACIASALWYLCNRFLTHSSHTHATDQKVEWAYAFDIHVNSFLPLFFQLYVAQLFLSPVLTRGNWICLFAGNTLYLAALSQYVYVTYLGYNALPFLIRSELMLAPIPLLLVFYVISLLGFNVSAHVLHAYFDP